MNIHETYMHRCLQLASFGIRQVAPNPMVGAVIVHEDKILGEGYHRYAGGPHAEIEAIRSVEDCTLLKDAVLYVSLEPCNHYGKTPPCTEAILNAGIKKVVIAHIDPFPGVNGSGIKRLSEKGIEVITGVLEKEAKSQNKRFLTFHTKKRPYIILKWAMSPDGFMGISGKNIKISNEESSLLTHQWRSEEQAILVGSNTVITDDPLLNTRFWPGENPQRIILDQRGTLPADRKIFQGGQSTLVFSGEATAAYPNAITIHLSRNNFFEEVISSLFERNIQSVLIEGGASTLRSFLNANLWDEIRVFIAPHPLGSGIKAPDLPEGIRQETMVGNNRLIYLYR